MRLLNIQTLEFEEFFGEAGNGIPPYAILSHTWGDDEVSYKDHVQGRNSTKTGYDKIRGCAKLAEAEGFRYFWIDTCCIDKSSSAELSEAINSMFQWYRDAAICYAYLVDVDSAENPTGDGSSFSRSRWFKRGWTLQELLAPAELVFVGSDWREIGTKKSLCATVSQITGIGSRALEEWRWSEYSVAQKMSWAVGRETTRAEDQAYCLMGLFDVNMPMLYGEGHKAFSRLQQEILKQSDDQSLFAWSYPEDQHSYTQLSGLLAPSPEYFKHASKVELLPYGKWEQYDNPFELVHQLIRINMDVVDGVQGLGLHQTAGVEGYQVIEIDQRGTKKRLEAAPASPNKRRRRDSEETKQVPVLSVPYIVIDVGEPSYPLLETQDSPVNYRRRRMSDRNFFDGPRRITDTEMDMDKDNNTQDNNSVPTEPSFWRWYIYEPVKIVPLRCHISGPRLGILLSRSTTGTRDGVLSRLHNPSLVTLAPPQESQLSPIKSYARIADRPGPKPHRWRATKWPEIKFSSVTAAGYCLQTGVGPNWEVNKVTSSMVPRAYSPGNQGIDTPEYAPLIMFYRMETDNQEPTVFVVSIPVFEVDLLTCEVCVFGDSEHCYRSVVDMEYDIYTHNLANLRQAKIPLGNNELLVIKFREGAGVNYVILGIEEVSGREDANARSGLVSRDMTKTAWLNQRLFPMLRSLTKSMFKI
ncbi:vegetative incompatibility protein HET-E-1 [Podospora fimiseda]|uniref:Vegetative incompatibility protein HET-E-1 n=1 Tax=Podospora fimiseda TaxID=252190 RepID=A0AAN7GUT3_9PEZI|nr:vegetative incompatibility protein HET-E-1 [Podospora fimiseda]